MSYSTQTKTVYFVRHGESESNAKMKVVIDSLFGLSSVSNYNMLNVATFWAALVQLVFDSDEDPDLSELGIKQVCLQFC